MTEGEFIVEEAVEALSEYDIFQALEARLEEILVSTISASGLYRPYGAGSGVR